MLKYLCNEKNKFFLEKMGFEKMENILIDFISKNISIDKIINKYEINDIVKASNILKLFPKIESNEICKNCKFNLFGSVPAREYWKKSNEINSNNINLILSNKIQNNLECVNCDHLHNSIDCLCKYCTNEKLKHKEYLNKIRKAKENILIETKIYYDNNRKIIDEFDNESLFYICAIINICSYKYGKILFKRKDFEISNNDLLNTHIFNHLLNYKSINPVYSLHDLDKFVLKDGLLFPIHSVHVQYEINTNMNDDKFVIISEMLNNFHENEFSKTYKNLFIKIFDDILISIFFNFIKSNLKKCNLNFYEPNSLDMEKIRFIIKNITIQEYSYISYTITRDLLVKLNNNDHHSQKYIYNYCYNYVNKWILNRNTWGRRNNNINVMENTLSCPLNKFFFATFFKVTNANDLINITSTDYSDIVKNNFDIEPNIDFISVNSYVLDFWSIPKEKIKRKSCDYWKESSNDKDPNFVDIKVENKYNSYDIYSFHKNSSINIWDKKLFPEN